MRNMSIDIQLQGLALNCALLEDVLPSVVHVMNADVGCRTLVRLYELLVFLTEVHERQCLEGAQAHLDTYWNEVG
jgi:hypothetical protein